MKFHENFKICKNVFKSGLIWKPSSHEKQIFKQNVGWTFGSKDTLDSDWKLRRKAWEIRWVEHVTSVKNCMWIPTQKYGVIINGLIHAWDLPCTRENAFSLVQMNVVWRTDCISGRHVIHLLNTGCVGPCTPYYINHDTHKLYFLNGQEYNMITIIQI